MTSQMHETSEKFYNNLQDTINNVLLADMVVIMGDLNARVSKENQLPLQQLLGWNTSSENFFLSSNKFISKQQYGRSTNSIIFIIFDNLFPSQW